MVLDDAVEHPRRLPFWFWFVSVRIRFDDRTAGCTGRGGGTVVLDDIIASSRVFVVTTLEGLFAAGRLDFTVAATGSPLSLSDFSAALAPTFSVSFSCFGYST